MPQTNQIAKLNFVVTNTLIVKDIQQSVAFYRDVLGATVLREGEPTFLRLGNVWLTINRGGGPTDDKPEVIASPPRDPSALSIFLNLRVTDIRRLWLIRLRDHRTPVDPFTGDDALARTVTFIHQRNTADRGFELFHAQVAARIILHMRHDELAATFFGRDIIEDRLHFANRVGQHRIRS